MLDVTLGCDVSSWGVGLHSAVDEIVPHGHPPQAVWQLSLYLLPFVLTLSIVWEKGE